MRWTQLLAGAVDVLLVGFVWVNGSAAAGLLVLAGILYLTVFLRFNEAGDAITSWAAFVHDRQLDAWKHWRWWDRLADRAFDRTADGGAVGPGVIDLGPVDHPPLPPTTG